MAIGGVLVFVATNFFADPIKRIGNGLYSSYLDSRNSPTALLCAPLQESRFIARQGGEIIADGVTGTSNLTSVFFLSNNTEIADLQLMLYPLGHHDNDPLIYSAMIVSSDLISGREVDVAIAEGVVRISAPRMAQNEFIHIEALFGQPVSLILEVRSATFSGEFYGIAGCPNGLDTFQGPPAEVIHQYVLSTCGENSNEPCGISGPTFEFEITEERVMPTIEQWIVTRGEKLYFAPQGADP